MRASTIFALIIAVLLGLGAAVAVKATGFLSGTKEARREAPAPQIVIAAANIFAGAYVQPTEVKLRAARTIEEVQQARNNELLPPLTAAAVKRMALVDIVADTPIRKDMLEDPKAPLDITAKLDPGTRAVNVVALKEHCAGCLIKTTDRVDIALLTNIVGPDGTTTRGCTAIIARDALVVAKRNSLYPMPGSVSGVCPCNFTLSVNPYRAGLIEFAKDKGILALQPVSEIDRRIYESRIRPRGDGTVAVSWSIPGSPEYADEDKRVADYLNGNYVIGEKDLFRLCGVSTVAPEKIPERTRIMKVTGLNYVGDHVFDAAGYPAGFVGVGAGTGTGDAAATGRGSVVPGANGPTPNNFIPGGSLPRNSTLPSGRGQNINSGAGIGPYGATGGIGSVSDIRVGVFDPSAKEGRVVLASNPEQAAGFQFRTPEGAAVQTAARASSPCRTCRSCQQR